MKVVDMQAKFQSIDTLLNNSKITCIVRIKIVLVKVIHLDHSRVLQRTVGHIGYL